jgi:hypothetical protein
MTNAKKEKKKLRETPCNSVVQKKEHPDGKNN